VGGVGVVGGGGVGVVVVNFWKAIGSIKVRTTEDRKLYLKIGHVSGLEQVR